MIVSWELALDPTTNIKDEYGCFAKISQKSQGNWTITDINNEDGASYGDRTITVLCLRDLIQNTFPGVAYKTP